MATRPSRSYRPDDPRTLPATRPCPAARRQLLQQRRRDILAETAARLLAEEDPDSQVMPMLHRTLTAELIIDVSLGFIITAKARDRARNCRD